MAKVSLFEFADKINEIFPVMMKEFARQQGDELYKEKITLPQFFILVILNRSGESKMTDMAHSMNVTSAAMTGIIERLVNYGYVTRLFDFKDRRIIRVKLTQKGEDLLRKINQQRRKMIINIFGKISQSEREAYLRILTQIYSILMAEGKKT